MSKHIPERQCMGCRLHKPKAELLRVVRGAEGAVFYDPTGRKPGRGVYICREAECFKRIRKSRALERSLSTAVPPEVYDTLEALIHAG